VAIFDFFRRRRERESAIPGGLPESFEFPPDESPGLREEPVGRPFSQAGPQQINVTAPAELGSIFAMVQEAFKTGMPQISQTDDQVIDLSGSDLRERILDALRQHGIDPETTAASQIDAGAVPGLQDDILGALKDAGVDLGRRGESGSGDAPRGDGSGAE